MAQTVDIGLANVMQKRFYDKLDSAQIVINYSTRKYESRTAAFNKDRAGKWHGQIQEVHVLFNGVDSAHGQTTITYYTLLPKTDWQSIMVHFYQPNLDRLPGITKLNGVTDEIKGHTLNSITYRNTGKDAIVCEFGEITARADQKQHPELTTVLEILKMPDKYFSSKKLKN